MQRDRATRRSRFARRLGLVVLGVALSWAGNGAAPLWDRDEPRFVQAAREMRERGDWVVPTFGGEGRYHKPVLVYWVILAGTWVLGDGPFGARAGSGVLVALAALAAGLFARELAGGSASEALRRRVELWTALMTLSAPVVFVVAHLAIADGALLLWVVLVQWMGWRLVRGCGGLGSAMVFWVAMGLGILTKGPIAPMVYLATLAATRALTPLPAGWAGRHRAGLGVALLLAVTLPWAIAAQARTGGAFLREAISVHVVARSLRPFEGHGFDGALGWLAGLPAYIVVLPLISLPWCVLGVAGFLEWRRGFDRAYLTGWVVGPLVVLSLAATKLPHYVLPLVPALAACAGLWLAGALRKAEGKGKGKVEGDAGAEVAASWALPQAPAGARFALAGLYGVLALALGGAGSMLLRREIARELLGARGVRALAVAGGIGVCCLVAAAVWSLRTRTRARWATGLVVATLFFELTLALVVLPQVGRVVVWESVAADVRALGGGDRARVLVVGEPEPGLVYALGGMPVVVDEVTALALIAEWGDDAGAAQPAVLVADLGSVGAQLGGELRGLAQRSRRGIAVAKGRVVDLVVVGGRRAGR
jgi:4-amino-4-deoxy-L-arabinose transferase-like glycosyltransferase